MVKRDVRAVFLIPFYDKDISQLEDTIDSIQYYMKDEYSIVCINDCKNKESASYSKISSKLASKNIVSFTPESDANWPRNTYGSLFCKKYQAMKFVINTYRFDYLISMDTDALVTGCELIDVLEKNFKNNNSDIGIIGSYKVRADGKKRTHWEWALFILYLVYCRKKIKKKSFIWNTLVPLARKNGYKLGEHMLGGAFISSYKFIQRAMELYPYDLFLQEKVYLVDVGDDVIFSLLAFACNFKIADFGRPEDPLTIAHKYLPIPKEEVVKQKKQIIHSVKKGYYGETEEDVRRYFKGLRI